MRETAFLGTILGVAVVGAMGGEEAAAPAVAPIEVEVPVLPENSPKPLPILAGDLQGFVVRVGGVSVLTPAVEGERVFAGDVVHLRAYDALDGKPLWSERVDDSQPTAPAVSSGHVYFNTESCTLYGVTARTGERDWSRLVANAVYTTPAVLDDRIFVTGPAKTGGFKLEAYGARSGGLAFRIPLPADALSAPVACGDRVYLALADGSVLGVDRAGKVLWRRETEALAAPWPCGDRLLVACGDPSEPDLVILDRRTGTPADRAVATPATDGKLVPGGEDAPRGGAGARPQPPVVPPTSPGETVGGGPFGRGRGGPVPPGGRRGPVGEVPGSPRFPGLIGGFGYEGPRPCVLGATVALAGGSHLVLRGLDGRAPVRVDLGAAPAGAPVAAGTLFVQATVDGRILGIDPVSGALRFDLRLRQGGKAFPLSASPAVHRGRAYLGTPDGSLLAVDLPDPSADGWPMWGGSASRSK
jgi:hypothetical protein